VTTTKRLVARARRVHGSDEPSCGTFRHYDRFEASAADPLSLHKYSYAHQTPVNGFDPTGHNFVEILTTIGIQVAKLINIVLPVLAVGRVAAVAAASLAFRQPPDAVGFGFLVDAGVGLGGGVSVGGLGGFEVVFAPHLHQAALYGFGAGETFWNGAEIGKTHGNPKGIKDFIKQRGYAEFAVYEVWYWGLEELGGDGWEPFGAIGFEAITGQFAAVEMSKETKAMLFGVTWSTNPGSEVFAFGGLSHLVGGPWTMDKWPMVGAVSGGDALLSAALGARTKTLKNPYFIGGGVMSSLLVGGWTALAYDGYL
jgi:hypothetical protein